MDSVVNKQIIQYTSSLEAVDWEALKATLERDAFDNGRDPRQLRESFEHSYAISLAYAGDLVIGTARALSDGVCNAYIVDVWTLSTFRRQGIATQLLENLLERLPGQHVYLFTDQAQDLYAKLGFKVHSTGMGKVVGEWLNG